MTDPTLEEQIEFAIGEYQDAERNLFDDACRNISAILASLKELQSIRAAELPVEPESVKRMRRYESGGYAQGNVKTGDVINHIDALKSALQVAQQEIHRLQAEVVNRNQRALDGDAAVAANNLAHEYREKAEAELAAIRSAELPVEPKIYTKTFMSGDTMEEHEVVLKHDYDALRAYALKEKERADMRIAYEGKTIHEHFDARLKAESELAAIKEKLREPSEGMIQAAYPVVTGGYSDLCSKDEIRRADCLGIFRAMSAVLLKEGNES